MPVNLITGTDLDDTINGTDARDRILALGGNDWVVSNKGHDTIDGAQGNDSIFAYVGGAVLIGGDGNDELVAADYTNTAQAEIRGGRGDDLIRANSGYVHSLGGQGDDTVTVNYLMQGQANGGAGKDLLWFEASSFTSATMLEPVVLHLHSSAQIGATATLGLSGFEKLYVVTSNGDDEVVAGDYRDVISLGAGSNSARAKGGDDEVSYYAGGQNTLSGGDGQDHLFVNGYSFRQGFFLVAKGHHAHDNYGSVLSGFEDYSVWGSILLDRVHLAAGDDNFDGRSGRDI